MGLTVHENAGMIVEMTADATLQGAAILKQEESLIGEALEDVPELTGKKDGSGKCIPCKQGICEPRKGHPQTQNLSCCWFLTCLALHFCLPSQSQSKFFQPCGHFSDSFE